MSEFNHESLYEVVVLENGDIALRRIEDKGEEPLVTIHFSPQSNFFLGDARVDVARAMIEAGLDTVSCLEEFIPECNEYVLEEGDVMSEEPDPVVH